MMMYANYSSSSGSYSDAMKGNSQQHQNCVDLPSLGAQELIPSQQGILSNLGAGSHSQDQTYNVWRDGRNEMLFMQLTGAPTAIQSIGADDLVRSSVTEDSQMGIGMQLGILGSGHNLQGQLSLSLSPQMPSVVPASSFQFHHPNLGLYSFLGSHQTISGEGGSGSGSCRDDEGSQNKQSRNHEYFAPGFHVANRNVIKWETLNNLQCSLDPKQIHSNSSPYGLVGFTSTIPNSKYLKATQQLLDEVVNVRKALKQHEVGVKSSKEIDGGSKDSAGMLLTTGDNQEMATNSGGELSPVGRQDLQNKFTKLLSMLDEVDRRYRQYYHQMQIVVSSFDVVSGCGAAKPYTALALETISRHFRCLRDAISGQINATRSRLGEQDTTGNNKVGGISRLRFVDQHLRQQKAFQQLGIMQQHAWRPQRGLPESSVSVLRAWLFEHFLHPYPKDSDKIMLARQACLTRSQVSNWFINARVRLWKPMVEEMYKQEFGDNEIDSISSSENIPEPAKENNSNSSSSSNNNNKVSEDGRDELQQSFNLTTERFHPNQLHESKCNPISDVQMSGSMAGTSYMNAPHGEDDTDYMGMKLRGDQRPSEGDSSLLQDDGRFISADAAYQMAELERFGNGGGVSLTLGLQHCDAGALPMSGGTHNNFIHLRGDEMYTAATSLGDNSADFDCIDPGNRRHRFSSPHMLHDFVA